MNRPTLLLGDCLPHLKAMSDNSIDAVITDSPYGLSAPPDIAEVLRAWLSGEAYEHGSAGFMGRVWDSFVPGPRVWREVFRVLKPGGHAVVFAGTRTVDLMGIAVRLGGFEVRDCGAWVYWSGFPKSLDLSKEADRVAGAEREVVGRKGGRYDGAPRVELFQGEGPGGGDGGNITAPNTPEAQRLAGHGTALKPAIEPWLLLRKPISESSIIRNVQRWGTGGLNLDACRFAPGDPMWVGPDNSPESINAKYAGMDPNTYKRPEGVALSLSTSPMPLKLAQAHPQGRFPANLIHSPKANRREREMGCEGLPTRSGAEQTGREAGSAGLDNPRSGAQWTKGVRNHHPTVKPLRVMQWLCRLACPPGGHILDPFMGSGTTGMAAVGQGFEFTGCELEPDHMQIARARIEWAGNTKADCDLEDIREPPAQTGLFT